MNDFESLKKQQYLNIETFRKSGEGVRTPVWFVEDDGKVFIRTVADSGKVKRIRRNPQVMIAPCKMDGAVTGDWFPANAREITDKEADQKVNRLLDKKYGLMKKIFGLSGIIQKEKYTVLEVKGFDHP